MSKQIRQMAVIWAVILTVGLASFSSQAAETISAAETGEVTEAAETISTAETEEMTEAAEVEAAAEQKVVSVLGDSTATFKGYNPWNIWYYDESMMSVSQTWWMQYIETNNMRLGVCGALGGSSVSYIKDGVYDASGAMCSEERIRQLGENGIPDVILFFGGINDINVDVPCGSFSPSVVDDIETFAGAYNRAVVLMKQYYPDAEIICLTPYLTESCTEAELNQYCNVIRQICAYYQLTCVDLEHLNLVNGQDLYAVDGLHPTVSGMNKIFGMLNDGAVPLESNGIEVLKNDSQGIQAHFNVGGTRPAVLYRFTVYNAETGVTLLEKDWGISSQLVWTPDAAGIYRIQCQATDGYGTYVSDQLEFGWQQRIITYSGIYLPAYEAGGVVAAGMVTQPRISGTQYQWLYYDYADQAWHLLRDWGTNECVYWKPSHGGSYVLFCYARTPGGEVVTAAAGVDYKDDHELTGWGIYLPDYEAGGGISAGMVTAPAMDGMQYQWLYYDYADQAWHLLQDWNSGECVYWKPSHAGNYLLHCYARTPYGQTVSDTVSIVYEEAKFNSAGIYLPSFEAGGRVEAGMVTAPFIAGTQYQWLYYDYADQAWHLLQDWSSYEWVYWKPSHSGHYLLHCYAKAPSGNMISSTIALDYETLELKSAQITIMESPFM